MASFSAFASMTMGPLIPWAMAGTSVYRNRNGYTKKSPIDMLGYQLAMKIGILVFFGIPFLIIHCSDVYSNK